MSYKSMVVHLDNDRRCAERIDIAARLALDFDAHLAGLYLLRPPEIPSFARAEVDIGLLEGRLQGGSKGRPNASARCFAKEPSRRAWTQPSFASTIIGRWTRSRSMRATPTC